MDDKQFKEALREFLIQFSGQQDPVVPLEKNSDGTIDRVATLALPIYEGFVHPRLKP